MNDLILGGARVANDPIVGKIAWYARKNYDEGDTEMRLPYATLCSHGIKPQGEPVRTYDDSRTAWTDYWARLAELTGGQEGVLHWRHLPNLVEDEVVGACYVISRVAFEPLLLQNLNHASTNLG